MDAGVPITAPVGGISAGLITQYGDDGSLEKYVLLTDILGSEDHFGDMDFKLCGTRKGVTGFQLDLKLRGISHDIMTEAIHRAREARQVVLDVMEAAIDAPRESLKSNAPRIESLQIDPDKIGALIGPGGKTIRGIQAESGADVSVEDDGTVKIYCNSGPGLERALEMIKALTKEIEIGETYNARVVSTKDFGAFVECLPGKEGLVHISELADFRVKQTEDVVKQGDYIWVKCIGIDQKGRIKLSRKAAMAERGKDQEIQGEEQPEQD
jgi:polyribonucleotide nucleotidyltransferase